MTPEQAFEKWWYGPESWCEDDLQSRSKQAFLAGQQFQETNQLMVLADIRKAVGDGEGRLSQEELVKRIEGLLELVNGAEEAFTFQVEKTRVGGSWQTPPEKTFWQECEDYAKRTSEWIAKKDALLGVKSVMTEKEKSSAREVAMKVAKLAGLPERKEEV